MSLQNKQNKTKPKNLLYPDSINCLAREANESLLSWVRIQNTLTLFSVLKYVHVSFCLGNIFHLALCRKKASVAFKTCQVIFR